MHVFHGTSESLQPTLEKAYFLRYSLCTISCRLLCGVQRLPGQVLEGKGRVGLWPLTGAQPFEGRSLVGDTELLYFDASR